MCIMKEELNHMLRSVDGVVNVILKRLRNKTLTPGLSLACLLIAWEINSTPLKRFNLMTNPGGLTSCCIDEWERVQRTIWGIESNFRKAVVLNRVEELYYQCLSIYKILSMRKLFWL